MSGLYYNLHCTIVIFIVVVVIITIIIVTIILGSGESEFILASTAQGSTKRVNIIWECTAEPHDSQDLIDFQAEEIKAFDPLSRSTIIVIPLAESGFLRKRMARPMEIVEPHSEGRVGGAGGKICSKPKHY